MSVKDIKWFEEKILQYPESKNHNPDLVEFVTEMKKLSRDARREVVSALRFEPMFELVIKWNNPVYAEPFYDLVSLVFEVMKASDVVTVYESYLRAFIDHVKDTFQDLVFTVLERVVVEGDLETLVTHRPLLLEAARVLIDRRLDTATPCLVFLTRLAHEVPQGTRLVFMGDVGTLLKDYAERDKTPFFRIYEIATSVACVSPEALEVLLESGILAPLHEALQGPAAHTDQLSFANTVEVFRKLSAVPHCYVYLQNSGVVTRLQERVVEYCPGTMEDKVMPTIFEFFGDVFAREPAKMAADAPAVVPTLLRLISTPVDRTHVVRAALVMIGQVATLPLGKKYLQSQDALLRPVLAHAAEMMRSGDSDNKLAALDFTEALIFTKSSADQSAELMALTESWFLAIMGSVKSVWTAACEPYPDIAQAAVQLLAVVSTQPWGRRRAVGTAGLLEWLMNRQATCGVHPSTGSGGNPEVLRAKYAVVKHLLELPGPTEDLELPQGITEKMATFVREGPIFLVGTYEVAMEGGDS